MEPKTPAPAVAPATDQPSPAPASPNPAPTATPSPTPQQIVDVKAPPAQTAEEVAESTQAPKDQQPPEPRVPPQPKNTTTSDVKLAIIATVIIIIALAGLATYAFLQQK